MRPSAFCDGELQRDGPALYLLSNYGKGQP